MNMINRTARWWLLLTVLLGVVAAVLVGLGAPRDDRTLAFVNGPTRLAMSLTAPFIAVLPER